MCSVAYNLMFYVYNENFYKIAYYAEFGVVKVESVENKIKWNLM